MGLGCGCLGMRGWCWGNKTDYLTEDSIMVTNYIFSEIAYALSHNRLCLFTGSGFTKAITGGNAPSWDELLEQVCKNNGIEFFSESHLSLEEKAHLIAEMLRNKDKNIYFEISSIIQKLKLSEQSDIKNIKNFFRNQKFHLITTNYDKLAESLVEDDFHSLSPGKPIPKSSARTKIYHIHGSIDCPDDMVVTAEDYFKFINYESYFSRKLSVCLHENLVVILGYSLSDTNLKAIINEYKGFSSKQYIPSNIIFVSRQKTSQPTKDYYLSCFGIRVIDSMEIERFFEKINNNIEDIKNKKDKHVHNIKEVLYNGAKYSDAYLKTDVCLFEVISSIQALGIDLRDENVTNLLKSILNRKIKFTGESGAWDQYQHLALWLTYLNSIIHLSGSALKEIILECTNISLSNCAENGTWGTPWEATKEWKASWSSIIPSNRLSIKEYCRIHLRNDFAKRNILGIEDDV